MLDDMDQTVPILLVGGLESISYFITLLPVSINGLGVQELSIAVLFSAYGGASQESGLTLAILYRTLMLFASLPGALFIPGMLAGEKQPQA
ncbi:MAG: hypothetical protein EHM70_14050 [Chloroflexota bacterium]|nr:MAG: hypothetical protein EHM70_14050 [Chloroflexota bacterium]